MKYKVLFAFIAMMFFTSLIEAKSTKFDPPMMGWSSWNTFRLHISDSLIKNQADVMVAKGLKDVGYNYVNVDDGFFGWRDETGKMHAHPQRFPNGLKGVADYIHSLGLNAGIYSDAGSNTCGSIWGTDVRGVGSGLYGHERIDAELYFNEWNFDFIKVDYCGAGHTLALDEQKRYTEIREAIDAVSKRKISMNICRWAFPGTWAKDISTSWRISVDITLNWNSVKHIINKNMYLSAYAGDGYFNDMDMLEIGRTLPLNEEEVHFGMWCIMSSPLLIGCDLTKIPDASLALLKNKELIALNQDPLGLQAYVAQHDNDCYVLVKDIEQRRGNVRAVALYNPTDTVKSFDVPLDILELDGKVKVRDLVKQKNIGTVKDKFTHTLPARSVLIVRMDGEKRLEPTLYEAEWAYLNLYNDLGAKKKSISFAPMTGASGGMKVTNIGGEKDNYAEWRDVFSTQGGAYEMTISYVADKNRKLDVIVNDKVISVDNLNQDPKAGLCKITIPIELRKGDNTIRMCSPYDWTPDIDCFKIKKM